MTLVLCALFFLSGTAALVFETLWFRQAGLTFGNGVWASSLVLSSFMAGLALGNGLIARLGARVRRPVRVYAWLEGVIAGSGVALVWLLPSLTAVLAPVLRPFADQPWLLNPLRLAIAFALLLVPATAMGATLPLLVKALRSRDPSFGSALGRLYGWNTLGAVAGALVGELWWIEAVGLRGTAWLAAAANLTAAVGALWIATRLEGAAGAGPDTGTALPLGSLARRRLAAAALSGLLLLALEVVWFRFLHLFVHSGSAAFAWMLAAVLAGIACGGAAAGRWLRLDPGADRHVPTLALVAGALTVLLYAGFLALGAPGSSAASTPLRVLRLCGALAFPVAFCSGALFPLIGSALARDVAPETRAAGLLTLWNTVGAALGSLLGGFLLLPLLGMERSLFVLGAGYGAVAWLARAPASDPAPWLRRFAPFALFIASLALFPFGAMERDYLRIPVERWHGGIEHEVLAVREGRTETAVYVRRRSAGQPLSHFLMTDSFSMSGTALLSRRYMKQYVYWPLALRPDLRSALLISYGVGSTAKALTENRSLESIDVVDISRDILELSDLIYPDPAEHPLRDPRVTVHIEDGRYFLQLTRRRFDLITGEPPPPKNAGVVNLYTREHFALIRERLTEGGITTYWLPVHNLLASDVRSILTAFCEVFDDCTLWVGHELNWMLAGSRDATWAPSEAGFGAQWQEPRVAAELRDLGFERPELMGATFLADAAGLRELADGAPPLTDDFPKRISDRLQRHAEETFGPWMDVGVARERFRRSEFVREAWPPALRERTLAMFDAQAVINDVARRAPVDLATRLEAVERLLGEPPLRELALWRLGATADDVRAIEAALRSGTEMGPTGKRILAMRALTSGDDAAAVRLLREARAGAGADVRLFYLELYALCRADRVDEAQAAAVAARGTLPRDAESLGYWKWMRRRFGLSGPWGRQAREAKGR